MSENTQPSQRDNHFVPRLYLKRWADDENYVWAYRVLVSHERVPLWKRASTKGLAYHEHLYTRVLASGETDEFEKWMAREFENPVEDPIKRAVSGDRLSREDWQRLIRFVAAQDARTPARLIEMLRRWDLTYPELVQSTLEESVRKLGDAREKGIRIASNPNDAAETFPARVTTEIEPGAKHGTLRVETVAGRALWLYSLRHLLTRTVDVLLQHKWTVLRAPHHVSWVTSDSPVIKLNYHGSGSYDFKGGWGSPNTEILLPIGPKHIIYTQVGHRATARDRSPSDDIAAAFRRFAIEHAHRMVFASQPHSDIADIRQRVVDQAAFRDEQEQWNRWHQEQSAAERDLLALKK